MSGLEAFAVGVFVAAAVVITASGVWLRYRRPGRHTSTGPSWDRATHPYTVIRDRR